MRTGSSVERHGTPPGRHVFDGGRSLAIREGLEPVLDEVRALLRAEVGLVVAETVAPNVVCVLGYAGETGLHAPLRNEPLRFYAADATPGPHAALDITLLSTVRDFRLQLSSALVVPWREASGRAWLIVGTTPAGSGLGDGGLRVARRYAQTVRAVHREASDRGTIQLSRDLAEAIQAVTRASHDSASVAELLSATVASARELMGTEVAYVSLPEHDPEYFAFTAMLGIQTSAFRRLRVRLGLGLGGLARELRRTVRTSDYGADGQLREAPVRETRAEGIVSAMCTPLVVDGSIAGCLYVGNRHLTSFSETDASLLEEFAGHAAQTLRHGQLEEHRLEVMRQREQERLAHTIHDSVVRSLMQIGFEAEEGLLASSATDVRQRLASIGQAAEYCLESLREQLAVIAGDRLQGQDVSIGELTERLRTVHRRVGVTRTFELQDAELWSEIPEQVAKTLMRIGQEALVNAELHSGCTHEHIVLRLGASSVTLEVHDDGVGWDEAVAAEAMAGKTGHFGVRGMRIAAIELGGQLSIEPGAEHGLVVRATLPTDPQRNFSKAAP
jgi:signal transduction histidine kinase